MQNKSRLLLTDAIPFYEQAGFRVISEPFLDVGVPHVLMLWEQRKNHPSTEGTCRETIHCRCLYRPDFFRKSSSCFVCSFGNLHGNSSRNQVKNQLREEGIPCSL